MVDVAGPSVKLITDSEQFMALRAAWNAVAESSRIGRIFSSHEWFDAAWQWRQDSARLHLLCLFDDEKLAAILPLVSRDASSSMRHRELSFLTVPDTQACDVIVAERDRRAACEAFALELARRRREWDVIRLKYLPPGTVTASTLRGALEVKGLATRLQSVAGNLFVPLRSSWESYYAGRSRRLKKANNLAASRVRKAGAIDIEWLAPGETDASKLERFVEAIIAISANSWKTRTGNSLDNTGPGSFIRRLSSAAYERGWLSIWMLRINDRPLAMEYQLVADGRVHSLRSDFDAAFDDVSPGSYLNRYLLEQLCGRGLERYYMGPGDNDYKRRWTEQAEAIEELNVYGTSLRGRMLAAWEIGLKPVARKLRHRLRAKDDPKLLVPQQ